MRKIFALGLIALGASNAHAQWQLSGNAGTNPATHFIGTTDNVDLIFRRGNIRSGLLSIYNTSWGSEALLNNTSGSLNAAIGSNALWLNTEGNENIAVGSYALSQNTRGWGNLATGAMSLSNNTTGGGNVANGAYALTNNTVGYFNSAMGVYALGNCGSGSYNTASGAWALENTISAYNTAYGTFALSANISGFNNTAVGYEADFNDVSYSNTTIIGSSSLGTASNQVRLGNSFVTSIGGFAGWTNFSDGRFKKDIQENVPGLAFIKQLKAVTYHLDISGVNAFLRPVQSNNKERKTSVHAAEDEAAIKQKEQVVYTGFVAQDVEAAAKKTNYAFSGVDAPKNEKDVYGLRYAEFVVPLVKAVQELSEENDKLQSTLTAMQAQISELSQQLRELKGEAPNPASLKIYPNPASHSFIIETRQELKGAVIQLFDMSGKAQAVTVRSINATSREVQMPSLSKGMYVVKVIIGGQTATGTVTIQ